MNCDRSYGGEPLEKKRKVTGVLSNAETLADADVIVSPSTPVFLVDVNSQRSPRFFPVVLSPCAIETGSILTSNASDSDSMTNTTMDSAIVEAFDVDTPPTGQSLTFWKDWDHRMENSACDTSPGIGNAAGCASPTDWVRAAAQTSAYKDCPGASPISPMTSTRDGMGRVKSHCTIGMQVYVEDENTQGNTTEAESSRVLEYVTAVARPTVPSALTEGKSKAKEGGTTPASLRRLLMCECDDARCCCASCRRCANHCRCPTLRTELPVPMHYS